MIEIKMTIEIIFIFGLVVSQLIWIFIFMLRFDKIEKELERLNQK